MIDIYYHKNCFLSLTIILTHREKQFAAATGYTNIQIHLVESGRVKPSDKFLQKVGAVFGVSQEWLMIGVGDREARVDQVDDKLIAWLNEHPEIIQELRMRSELD